MPKFKDTMVAFGSGVVSGTLVGVVLALISFPLVVINVASGVTAGVVTILVLVKLEDTNAT